MAAARRKKKAATPNEATRAAEALIAPAPGQAEREIGDLPEISQTFVGIRESVFALPDPEGEYRLIEASLQLTNSLTPGNLLTACNIAEDMARRAHKLLVVAQADYDKFETERDAVIDGMREAATRELQEEKSRGERNKSITDADVRGRAAVKFPDEWKTINQRAVRAAGMISYIKQLARLCEQRCYTLASMLNAGKRA